MSKKNEKLEFFSKVEKIVSIINSNRIQNY